MDFFLNLWDLVVGAAVLVECMVQSGQWLGWRPRLVSRLSAGEEAFEAAAAASHNHCPDN